MAEMGQLRIDLDEILAVADRDGYEEMVVEILVGRDDLPSTVAALRRGMQFANGPGNGVWGSGPTATVDGLSVDLDDLYDRDAVVEWLTAFTEELAREGLSGRIHATRADRLPTWWSTLSDARLTAFVACEAAFPDVTDEPAINSEPSDASARTMWLRRSVDWVTQSGGDVYLLSGGLTQLDRTDQVAAHVARALTVSRVAGVACVDSRLRRARLARFIGSGQATFQAYDAADAPGGQIDAIRGALSATSAGTRLGFMAVMAQDSYGWDYRGRAWPLLPAIATSDDMTPRQIPALLKNTDMWDRYVPDVHGMQLLTERHMDHISNLSDWVVTPAGNARYVVEAAELSAWLTLDGPNETVLAKGRADFEGVIIPSGELV
jgi:hypothetical protein